jgi:hypothetical protein
VGTPLSLTNADKSVRATLNQLMPVVRLSKRRRLCLLLRSRSVAKGTTFFVELTLRGIGLAPTSNEPRKEFTHNERYGHTCCVEISGPVTEL